MDVLKLEYEIREKLPAISDDRYLDRRLILHTVDTVRAATLRNMLNNRTSTDLGGFYQDFNVKLVTVSRSIIPEVSLNCKVLRSENKLPALLNNRVIGDYYRIKSADMLHIHFNKISELRATTLNPLPGFVYVFVATDGYLYALSGDIDFSLEYLVLTGVFEVPLNVNPLLTDYPIKYGFWNDIKPLVLKELDPRRPEDPLNNDEPDLGLEKPK